MWKYLNGFTLIGIVVFFLIFLNTGERYLLNGGTLEVGLGITLLFCVLFVFIVNAHKCLTDLMDRLDEKGE